MDFSYIYEWFFMYFCPFLITVVAFLYSLFNSDRRTNIAFGFLMIGIIALVAGLEYNMLDYYLASIVMSFSIFALFRCGKKGTGAFAWVVSLVSVLVIILDYICRDVYVNNMPDMPQKVILSYIVEGVVYNIPTIVGLSLLTAATIIRTMRIKKGELVIERDERCLAWKVGNIFSVISFMAVVIGIKYLILYVYSNKAIDANFLLDYYERAANYQQAVLITSVLIALVCGVVGCALLHDTKKKIELNKIDYDFSIVDWTLYIWSAIIIFIAYLIMLFIIFLLSFMGDKNYRKAGTKEVTDENGDKHTLDYKGGQWEEVADEDGKVWVTDDGGLHFRERDKYVLKDKEGKEKTVYDPYGSTGGRSNTVVDEKCNVYDVDNWGNATKRGEHNE